MQILRCHHVKVNGTQCGSPALRGKCYCYFHTNYRHLGAYGVPQRGRRTPFTGRFPALEDANSVQAAVMQVIRLILAQQIDSKEAGLLLYALQIASSNLQHLRLEPLHHQVVVDPLLVGYSPIGGHPTREEQFKVETEEQEKERDELEHQIEQSQEQADAEWEAEVRQEFEAVKHTDAEPEPSSSLSDSGQTDIASSAEASGGNSSSSDGTGSQARPPHCSASPELIEKIQNAAASYQKYPADRELKDAYAALLASLGASPQKNKS